MIEVASSRNVSVALADRTSYSEVLNVESRLVSVASLIKLRPPNRVA